MTGKEFLEKVRGIKTITDIHWQHEGDVLDPDVVKFVVIADDEEMIVEFPRPGTDTFKRFAFIALVINKFMDQIGDDYRTNAYEEVYKAVNYSIKKLKEERMK